MNKLPEELLGEILAFLYKPSDCILKGYDQFLVIDKLTNKLAKKIKDKCNIDCILNRSICKTHCKAYPLYKKLDIEFKRQRNFEYLHFTQKAFVSLAQYLFPEKFLRKCCGGKGLKQRSAPPPPRKRRKRRKLRSRRTGTSRRRSAKRKRARRRTKKKIFR